jgi:hypothetical protein
MKPLRQVKLRKCAVAVSITSSTFRSCMKPASFETSIILRDTANPRLIKAL